MMQYEKRNDNNYILGRADIMKKYIKHHMGLLGVGIVLSLAEAFTNIILAFSMGNLSNAAVNQDIQYLFTQGGISVICLILILLFQILEVCTRKLFAKKCITDLKCEVYQSILGSKQSEFHKLSESYYMNLLQADIDTIYRDFFSTIGRIVGYALEIVISAVALIFVSVKIFVIFILVSSLPPIVLNLLKKRMMKVRERYSYSAEHYVKAMKEFIQGIDTITFFQKQRIFFARILQEDENLEQARMENDVYDSGGLAISRSVGMIAHICCMIAAAYFIVKDHMEIGVLITSTQLLNFIFSPFNVMNSQIASLRSTKVIRDKFEQVLSLEGDTAEEPYCEGDIVFDDVTLAYGEKILFEHLSYTFERGKKYAIIGKSGAGKTSIAKALTKFITPECGSIRVENKEISGISRDSLLKNILYVPQSAFLFFGSVIENITLFTENEKAYEIGKCVGLPNEILQKNQVGDMGTEVSGGERQRISVARAILCDPDVYIFDEPTSGLDPTMALHIEKYILDIKDKTVIVITHNWDKKNLERFDGVIKL